MGRCSWGVPPARVCRHFHLSISRQFLKTPNNKRSLQQKASDTESDGVELTFISAPAVLKGMHFFWRVKPMDTLSNLLREIWMRLARIVFFNRSQARFVVILGGPGFGKDTVAERLKERLGLPVLTTGSLLRSAIASGSALGNEIAPLVNSGKFVDDAIILRLVRAELAKPEYAHGAILNGIPRTLTQASALRSQLTWWGNKVNRVVMLEVSEEDVLERLSLRRICSNKSCNKSYHLKFAPSTKEGVCDSCKCELQTRQDDNPDVVRERLRVYNETFGPLRKFYEQSSLLTRVRSDNKKSVDEIVKDVIFTIEQFD
jgi:adenylate kinase